VAYAYSVERVGEGMDRSAKVFAEVRADGMAFVNNRPVDIGFGVPS
jgi:hypothetical protein